MLNISWDKVSGLIRHVLTFAGGYLIAKGYVDEATLNEIVAAGMTIIGVVWSWGAKKEVE